MKEAKKSLVKFKGTDISASEEKRILQDMWNTRYKLGFNRNEYFWYRFEEKDWEARHAFVPDNARDKYCRQMNPPEIHLLFDDKAETYRTFKEFYGRECCRYRGDIDKVALKEFVQKHDRFIIKPNDMYCGIGIKVVDVNSFVSIDEMINQLNQEYPKGLIAEELIIQSDIMSAFHPSSVNSVRMPTVRFDDRIDIIHPFMRIGRNGACVDNAGSGGIMATVDVESGILLAAADEHGHTYINHPNTNVPIVGFQIPRWEEAKALVRELAQVVPNQRYAGWDIALTDNGWVMIEGNARGQFVWQIVTQEGFRREIETIMQELNL